MLFYGLIFNLASSVIFTLCENLGVKHKGNNVPKTPQANIDSGLVHREDVVTLWWSTYLGGIALLSSNVPQCTLLCDFLLK